MTFFIATHQMRDELDLLTYLQNIATKVDLVLKANEIEYKSIN